MTSLHLYKYSMNKIEKFIKRNLGRNAHLYDDALIEGIDYVVCPVTNARLSMIKKSYIEKVLGMTVDEYDTRYPNVKKICDKRVSNIKNGLHAVDPTTGLTKYEISQIKAKEKLSMVGDDGLTGYARKGLKTKSTHMSNIDEFGRNGYSQLASKAIIKGNTTKAAKGLILDPSCRTEFYRYKSIVLYITEQFRHEITKGYKTGLAGTPGAYHIDHIFSIMQGYKDGVSPILVGSKTNLKMIPWKENISKHSASNMSLEELLEKSGYTLDRSKLEFEYFLNLIKLDIKNESQVSGARLMEKFYESELYRKQRV